MAATPDHLVVAARTLDEGVRWCETTLGITPGPGGVHPLMGTHNRLFAIGAGAYLEIIAIDPEATAPGRVRWFDLDDVELRASIDERPQLVHWVAQVPDIVAAVAVLAAQGIDRGRVLEVSRSTPRGELRWRISVRDDGARLMQGALPTLIEWHSPHPAQAMPDSGVRLVSLRLRSASPRKLASALSALDARGVRVESEGPALEAVLMTPRGAVTLSSAMIAP